MPTEDTFQKRRAELSAAKQALLEKRLQRSFTPATQALSMAVAAPSSSETTPLSFSQHRLWFLQQLEPQSAVYNEPIAVHLRGPLHLPALAQVATALSLRHAVLRTTFPLQDGQVVQLVHPPEPQQSSLPLLDLSTLPASERQAALHRHIQTEVQRPFDLTQDYPWRTLLLRLAPEEHVCLTVMHHIVTDAWSMEVFVREVGLLYAAFCAGQPSPLPPLPVQYAQYAQWQRQQVDEAFLTSHLAYWKRHLAGPLPRLHLPTDHARPPEQRYEGRRLPLGICAQTTQALHALSRQQGVTLFMTLLAALQLVLARLSQQQDVLIGSPIAGRTRPELEGLLGCFVNTLVLRTDLSGQPSVQELLQRVRAVTLGAYEHQDVPFEKLVEELQPERSLSHAPFFQVMFTLQNVPLASRELAGLTISAAPLEHTTAKFDLSLTLQELPEGLEGFLEYNTALFEEATIGRVAAYLQRVLQAMVADPTQGIEEIPLLSLEELQQFDTWNATERAYPKGQCLHEIVEEQVERTPNAPAVTYEGTQLTYRELNRRANQLANYLRTLGVGPEMLVGICMERSIEMVVGLLGILKAGAAYVPIDPTYPQERVAYMLHDAQPSLLLSQEHLRTRLPEQGTQCLYLDSDWQTIGSAAGASTETPESGVIPDNLAYVIYTSGSTGKPKGAMNSHRGIVNRLQWMQEEYRLNATDRVLQKTPFSFDVSVWEFFWPLMYGAHLIVARPEGHRDSSYLVNFINEQQITTLHFVPSMLSNFLEEPALHAVQTCQSLRHVICSGEALPFELQQRFFERFADPAVELHNLYGPTEAAVDVTYWACERESKRQIVPIGRPIANMQMYLLDEHLNRVPVGVSGELYIGGIGLGRGYLHRRELTAEKFIASPFDHKPGARLYKTGDIARYLSDGSIEYLGRNDHQVKIRGFRIELGEIEAVLGTHPAVHECVVVVQADASGNKYIIAYIVLEGEQMPGGDELRTLLKQKLPEYMIPSTFMILDALPLSPNGKLDRNALPAPDSEKSLRETSRVAPRTPLEEELASIWRQILNIEQVGVYDDFFEIGGHSLLVTQVIARVRDTCHVDLPLQVMFKTPTIAALAEAIEKVKMRSNELHKPSVKPISRDAYRTKSTSLSDDRVL